MAPQSVLIEVVPCPKHREFTIRQFSRCACGSVRLTQAVRVTAEGTGWLLRQTAIAELKEENPSGRVLRQAVWGDAATRYRDRGRGDYGG